MCGIGGIVGEWANLADASVDAMHAALAHRGPDADGMYRDKDITLLHRRLSIIDLSAEANQPMTDAENRFTLVFNGEIYNYQEIRSQLKGYPFRTNNDAEVVLAAFKKYGADCLKMFNGMFAFAIWDQSEGRLFLCRDRLGIKPLYYFRSGNGLVFASEVRALLASTLVPKQVDKGSVNEFLSYQSVIAPKTIIKNVFSLQAGEMATFAKGEFKLERWWKPEDFIGKSKLISGDPVAKIRTLLSESVQRRMISDVPVGAFLSGGIDSSAIVALMAQASEKPIDTFSVVFGEAEYDESKWSDLLAKKYSTKHHPISIDPKDLPSLIPKALSAMDHPSGDGINSFLISEVTRRQGVKVALSGLGSDELFGGYPVFKQLPSIAANGLYWALPSFGRKIVASLRSGRTGEKLQLLSTVKERDLRSIYPVFRTVFGPEMREELLGKGQEKFPGVANAVARFGAGADGNSYSHISAMEMASYTNHVLLRDADQMSMAHALELRVPFFDHELVEYILGLPDEAKKGKGPKPLLVAAMGDDLPADIVNRKKMGFVFPWERWLRDELKDFAEKRINRLAEREFIDEETILSAWWRFKKWDPRYLWVHIWLLVVLEDWLERNLD